MRLSIVMTAALLAVGAGAIAAPDSQTTKPKENKAVQQKPAVEHWAVIETNKGTIKFKLYEQDAPITTKNFIDLANRKFYDGLTFHRVEPGFVIQGGDPKGNGTGNSDKTIPLEKSPKLKHDAAGVVAMARTQDPNSATCQFYITLGPAPFLDNPPGYAVFGRVTEGLDVVMKIARGDVMKTVRIIDAPPAKAPEKAPKPQEKPAEHPAENPSDVPPPPPPPIPGQ